MELASITGRIREENAAFVSGLAKAEAAARTLFQTRGAFPMRRAELYDRVSELAGVSHDLGVLGGDWLIRYNLVRMGDDFMMGKVPGAELTDQATTS